MATCERCNNLLPRTVDQCPVCGLLIDFADSPSPEFAPPVAPGWATDRPQSAGHDVDPFSQAPVWGGADQPGESTPSFSLDALAADPTDGFEVGAEASTEYAPTPDLQGSPIASQEPYPAYEAPASLSSSFDAPGYADHLAEPVAPGTDYETDIVDDPIPPPDPASFHAAPPMPAAGVVPDLPPPAARTNSSGPQRLGHDGVPVGAGVNPLASAPSDALAEDQSTRSVRAFSSRIEGDIKYGRSPRHNLLTSGILVLGLATLGLGAGAGLLAASAADSLQSFELEESEPIDTTIDLEAFHQTHGGNIVKLALSDCGIRRTVDGVASDATTVLVPWSDIKTDSTPIVTTPAGERVSSRVLGVDRSTGLAVVKVSEPLEAGGLGWSGGNQATAGTQLIVLHSSGRADRAQAIVSQGMTRNNDGIPGTILTSEETLPPNAFVATETGQIIGVVNRAGSEIVAADVIRSATGSIKVSPTNPSSVCPPPPPSSDEDDSEE